MANSAETLNSSPLRATVAETSPVIARHGGMSWGSDFIDFVVAIFFTVGFAGFVGATVGIVGYLMGIAVPKSGGHLSRAAENLGIGGLLGAALFLFLAFLIGGYTAGRMARFDGARNGLGVVLWTTAVAVVLGIDGGVLGSAFNLGKHLQVNADMNALATTGAMSTAVALVVMIVASVIGGALGANHHRRVDRDTRVVPPR